MRNNIPHNWIEARTGELFEMVGGGTPSTKTSEYWNGDTPWITSADILEDHRITPRRTVSTRGIAESATNKVPVGTLIVATRVGLGKAAVAEAPMCFSQDCQGLIVPGKRLDSGFLVYQIETITSEFIRQSQGTTIRGITKKALADLKLRIAPTQEQHRIVEAIESYLTRLDEAVASLERVQRNLERYRASILKAAVEGRLVPTEAELAKKEGRSYEPASELLKRILDERRKKWIENAAEKARAKAEKKARKAGKPWTHADDIKTLEKERAKAAKKYKEPATPDTSKLPDLPEGWCWATATQVGEAITGTTPSTKTPEYYGGDLPFFKPTDLGAGVDVRHARQYLTDEGISVSRVIPEGSILVTCIGATIGKTGLARVDCATNQQINALVSPPLIRETRYLFWFFVSPQGQQSVIGNASSTTLPILNKSRFERLPIPVPPLQEQTRIATELERTLSICGTTQQQFLKLRARCERLRQSILKWAFEGKLVPQDPSDEPASVLLERIKAEREFTQPRKRRRTGKRKNVNTAKHDGQLDLLGGSNK